MQSKPCPKCSAGKDKCCGECGEWEVGSRKTKLPEDVKKQTTKKAAIGSLMNTMGRVGGNQKKMKPMAISADALSAKPAPQPQLGAQTNNRFLQQADSLRSKVAENSVDTPDQLVAYYPDGTKHASHIDVSPYITSTYVQSLPYRRHVSTEQLYTKIASLESMFTQTLPSIFKALPQQYTAPVTNAIQAAKERYTPAVQSSAFSDGIKRLGGLFTDLGARMGAATPSPATVSRLSMLQRPQSQASPVPAQRPVNQAAGGARPNYAGYTSKSVGDVSNKAQGVAKTAPTAPPAMQKTPGKYTKPEDYTRAAQAADLQGRYFKAGLGGDQTALPPEEFVNRLGKYIAVNRPGDLSGLPAQHQQTYDALPEDVKNQIGGMLRQNLQMNALTRPDDPYQPAFFDKSIDKAVLSAAEPLNSITNTAKIIPTALGITNNQKTFSNLDEMRDVIGASGSINSLSRDIAALDTKMRRDAQNGTSDPKDMAELTRLLTAKRVSENTLSNTNLNAKDTMPLFDKDLTTVEKLIGRAGSADGSVKAKGGALMDALGFYFPTMTAAQSLARFGLNSADVQKADAYGDLLGILAPTRPSSAANAIKALLSPKTTLRSTADSLSKGWADFKNAPWYNKLWKPPVTAVNIATSPTAIRGAATIGAIKEDTPLDIENQHRNRAVAIADQSLSQPSTSPTVSPDKSSLYKYLLGAGLGIPAIMAIMASMSGKGDEEAPDEEQVDEANPEVIYGKA